MISVVIITLNEEKNIGNILEDLASQTYKNFEVLVIDSKSTDNTKKIAQSYANKFKAFTFHTLKNPGICIGRNTGAQKAKGDLIVFFDSDVRISKNFLYHCQDEIKQKNFGCAGVYIQSSGNHLLDKLYYSILNLWFFLMQKIYPHCVGSCIAAKKSVHSKIKGFDLGITLAEDNDYVVRASKITRYGMLSESIKVSPRRFEKEGRLKMGLTYFRIFIHRVFKGEIRDDRFNYKFGHYEK